MKKIIVLMVFSLICTASFAQTQLKSASAENAASQRAVAAKFAELKTDKEKENFKREQEIKVVVPAPKPNAKNK